PLEAARERARSTPFRQAYIQVGRSAAARRTAERRRTDRARYRACVRAREAAAADYAGVSSRDDRSGDLHRDGLAWPSRHNHPAGVRRRGPKLRLLWVDRTRGRARRLGLSFDDERAKLARDVSDLRVRERAAAQEISA